MHLTRTMAVDGMLTFNAHMHTSNDPNSPSYSHVVDAGRGLVLTARMRGGELSIMRLVTVWRLAISDDRPCSDTHSSFGSAVNMSPSSGVSPLPKTAMLWS